MAGQGAEEGVADGKGACGIPPLASPGDGDPDEVRLTGQPVGQIILAVPVGSRENLSLQMTFYTNRQRLLKD